MPYLRGVFTDFGHKHGASKGEKGVKSRRGSHIPAQTLSILFPPCAVRLVRMQMKPFHQIYCNTLIRILLSRLQTFDNFIQMHF